MGFLKDLFSSPKKPNAAQSVEKQQEINAQTQAANLAAARTDQVTPQGTLKYSQTGTDQFGNPTYTATSELTPERQAILDYLQSGAGSLAGNIANTYGDLPDFSTATGSLTSQMLDRQLAYMNPYYTQQTNNLDNALRNQGLMPGTPAYDNAMRTLRQTQNESVGQFINQMEPIAFNQAVTSYTTPVDTVNKLIGGANQMTVAPSILNTPRADVTSPDYIKAVNDQYAAELAARNQAWAGIFGGVGSVLGAPASSVIGSGLTQLLGLKPQKTATA